MPESLFLIRLQASYTFFVRNYGWAPVLKVAYDWKIFSTKSYVIVAYDWKIFSTKSYVIVA